ncbi:hypothetical protein [Amycolatopsis sp.]|jgi:hypothetical protein|uniref:hypothetical protein n=1 Tax=Amycolatopsis sp. TaxID=37632 RepID=UPI002DF821D9|nr:hypothetical protein [Amycolatopsis sp.]
MSDAEVLGPAVETRFDLGQPVILHPLVYLEDGNDVTVGRHDIESYAVLSPDGAALVRKLEDGVTPQDTVRWYEQEYGEPVDIEDMLEGLDELGFLHHGDQTEPAKVVVRWQHLGKALFSVPAWIAYGLIVAWSLVLMARSPQLLPTFHNIFFTDYYTVIQATLFVAAIPLLLLHESFHALAGRRLGLPSKLSIGRRFYFLVLETSMDSLVTVPRRQRYLPILAGMLADVVMISVFTIAADLMRAADGSSTVGARFCLAVAFSIFLRVLWQFSLYLRTDLYALVSTVLGCVDLHTTAKRTLANHFNRLLGRRAKLHDESTWHPVDRKVARWYSWLILAGYTVSLTTFVIALAPLAIKMFTGVLSRFFADNAYSGLQVLDSAVFLTFSILPSAFVVLIALRDRRRRRQSPQYHHVTA